MAPSARAVHLELFKLITDEKVLWSSIFIYSLCLDVETEKQIQHKSFYFWFRVKSHNDLPHFSFHFTWLSVCDVCLLHTHTHTHTHTQFTNSLSLGLCCRRMRRARGASASPVTAWAPPACRPRTAWPSRATTTTPRPRPRPRRPSRRWRSCSSAGPSASTRCPAWPSRSSSSFLTFSTGSFTRSSAARMSTSSSLLSTAAWGTPPCARSPPRGYDRPLQPLLTPTTHHLRSFSFPLSPPSPAPSPPPLLPSLYTSWIIRTSAIAMQ